MIEKTSKKKIIIVAVVILIIIVSLFVSFLHWELEPDAASERIIREEVARQLYTKDSNDLTDEDFAKITQLVLSNKELADIELLKKFTNLKFLQLVTIRYPANKIPKWMSFMSKFGLFNLNDKFALNLRPLENLSNLQSMNLSDIEVSSINSLAKQKNLQTLILNYTNIYNINVLANLTNLKQLYFYNSFISDFKPLLALKNLEIIYLNNTNVINEQKTHLEKSLPEANIYIYPPIK